MLFIIQTMNFIYVTKIKVNQMQLDIFCKHRNAVFSKECKVTEAPHYGVQNGLILLLNVWNLDSAFKLNCKQTENVHKYSSVFIPKHMGPFLHNSCLCTVILT